MFGLSALCGYAGFISLYRPGAPPRPPPRRGGAGGKPPKNLKSKIKNKKIKNSYYKQAALQSLRAPTAKPSAPAEEKTRKALQKKTEAVLALYGSRFSNRVCAFTPNFPAFSQCPTPQSGVGHWESLPPKKPAGETFPAGRVLKRIHQSAYFTVRRIRSSRSLRLEA